MTQPNSAADSSGLSSLLQQAKTRFDLTEDSHQESLYRLADQLLDGGFDDDEIDQSAYSEDAPLEFRIAAKLAKSKRYVATISEPIRVGVVFAMWGEHHRLNPKSESNPNGENSLRVKLEQMAWIASNSPVDWNLYAVDDGDPHGSAQIVRKISAEHPLGDRVTILELATAVPTGSGPLKNLTSADDSRKGGAIIYGADRAVKDGCDVVIYTDADNSVHLGQIGLLLQPFLGDGVEAVWGDRKNPEAVLVKQEERWGIGIKVLRHMQRMIGQEIFSRGISDTQAAFKLYSRELLEDILPESTIYDFSFDTDWILASLARQKSFARVPFAFIDSAAESASIVQGPMTTWETLLKGLVAAVRLHDVAHNEEMAQVIDEEILSSKDLDLLIDHLPSQLASASNEDLGDPDLMSPAELRSWIRDRKNAG